MLDYTRERKIEKTRCQVNEMLGEIAETFAEEMAKRNIKVELDLDAKCPRVMIDQDGLDKAVVNLLINAAEARTAEGEGKIVLRSRLLDNGNLVVEVEDDSGGIEPEVLARLFTPFFTTKGAKGSGLGLAMTRKFIEDMGGNIDVRSELGKGTCFTITIVNDHNDIRLESASQPNISKY
jgi:signal transduction histidine kinase